MKYTREDVIVTREQAEEAGLKVGSICYVGDMISACIKWANNNEHARKIESIDWDSLSPFRDEKHGLWWDCVIIKKEPEKKIVPFDFSLEEDRKALRDRWIISKETGSETRIQSFTKASNDFWTVDLFIDASWISTIPSVLLEDYVFADGENKGKPVGKEVIE